MVKRYNPAEMVEHFNGGWVRGSDFDRAVALLRAVQNDVMIREHDAEQQREARQMWSDIDAFLTSVDR